MPVYYFIFGWTVFWGCIANMTARRLSLGEEKYRYKVNIFVAILAFSAVVIFAGLRTYVADTSAYINMFNDWPTGFSEISNLIKDSDNPGFIILGVFIKTYISTDYTIWLFIIATITGVCMMIGFYRYSSNFALSSFLFIATSNFTWMFNGMRQYLVVAILFAFSNWIVEKKLIRYIILVLILTTIHRTAIAMIPMYFIVNGEPWNKRTTVVILIVILCIIFAGNVLNLFDSVMMKSDYATGYSEFKQNDDGVNIITIIISAIPVVISYIFRKQLSDKYTPIMKISTNMSIIAVCVYIISKITNSGILVGRMAVYFTTYNLILLPWLIDTAFKSKEKLLMKYMMIICYLALFYYQMEISFNGFGYISKVLNIHY